MLMCVKLNTASVLVALAFFSLRPHIPIWALLPLVITPCLCSEYKNWDRDQFMVSNENALKMGDSSEMSFYHYIAYY